MGMEPVRWKWRRRAIGLAMSFAAVLVGSIVKTYLPDPWSQSVFATAIYIALIGGMMFVSPPFAGSDIVTQTRRRWVLFLAGIGIAVGGWAQGSGGMSLTVMVALLC